MISIVGLVFLFVAVFGGYVMAEGKMEPIIEAAPHEMFTIGGAAVAAMLVGNSMDVVKGVGSGIGMAFAGPRYHKQEHMEVMFLVVKLFKVLKSEGAVALEAHIENPEASAIFSEYPKLLKDHDLISMICDTVRLLVTSNVAPKIEAVEDALNLAIKTHHHNAVKPAEALAGMAGALPALGIVACVLGVVKTMGAIDQPPAVLGALIGGALVGTFLGVFLAYGIAEPLSTRIKQVIDEEGEIYNNAKFMLLGHLQGFQVPLIIEMARAAINHHSKPTFAEVFDGLRGK